MDNIVFNIIVLCVISIGVALFFLNFTEVMTFRWYIDYFKLHEKICASRYEVERYRYRLYAFLYNIHDKTYSRLYENYKTTYILFITYFSLFVFALVGVSYWVNIYTSAVIYAFIIVIWIVYTTVNGLLLDSFIKINASLTDKDKYIYKYSAVYKILNAIMKISNLKNAELEHSFSELNRGDSLDKMIEHNIAIYENINNISKIKNVKNKAYDELDFVKYLVLDRMSPYYLTYFDNVFIRLPDSSGNHFDSSENVYLLDISNSRLNAIDHVQINKIMKGISAKINELDKHKNATYIKIKNLINNDYPTETIDSNSYVSKIFDLYRSVEGTFDGGASLPEYNNELYVFIKRSLTDIRGMVESHSMKEEYGNINSLIKKELAHNSTVSLDVENGDYIQYYLDNKDVIFEEDKHSYDKFVQQFDKHNEFIYAYFVYILILLLLLMHYMYVNINHNAYAFIISGVIILYFTMVRMYSAFNFSRNI